MGGPFCKSQGYAEPPEDFHKNLKPYPTMEDCYALTECKSALRRAGFTDEAQG